MKKKTTRRVRERANSPRYAADEQSGKVYKVITEEPADRRAAVASVIYLLGNMVFFFWLLFDIWIGQYSLANLLGYRDTRAMASPVFRLAAYALIGGSLGGAVNGIRSFLVWHAERAAFGRRFVWKYVTLPWVGAALAVFTYALIRSGVAIFSGEGVQAATTTSQVLATFGAGALAGYGSHEVLYWLDAQVTRLFRVQPASASADAPKTNGKTANGKKKDRKLGESKLGDLRKNGRVNGRRAMRVIGQKSPPG